MDVDIIETSERINKNIASRILENYVKIKEIPGVIISNVKSTNVLFVNTNMECIQFNLDCDFQLDLKVHVKVIYPKKVPPGLNAKPIKLRINVQDEEAKKEIISCTNYLQRQRNINLALSILKRCAIFISERRLIYNMLLLHYDGLINSTFHNDGGVLIECEDSRTDFKFFQTSWKIYFNCKDRRVLDFIDFNITTQDKTFYNTAKPIMCRLVGPSLLFAEKVKLWSDVVRAANLSIRENAIMRRWQDEGVLNEEINSSQIIQYDISDSDDEDDSCIVIEDD